MKNLLFFSAILFTCQASAQSYIPLHLDTSCFWVLDYKQYDAYWVASGEHTAYVAGETTFNGKNYFVIDAYPSAAPYVSSSIYLNQYMNGNTNYLREDTAAKKIYFYSMSDNTEKIYLDFDLQPGDTTIAYGDKSYLIDSVAYQNILGVSRRCQFGHSLDYPNNLLMTIEGIGATNNFPVIDWTLEWYFPLYTLKCCSKYGAKVYGNSVCVKGLAYSSVANITPRQAGYIYANQKLLIHNPQHHPVHLNLYSADGKLYLSQTLHEESNTIPLYDLPTGIYIIRLRDNDRYITGKMLVE